MSCIRRPLDSADAGIGVWFPAVRTARGVRAGIAWLSHRTECLLRAVPVPVPLKPAWADIVHMNTGLYVDHQVRSSRAGWCG